MTTANLSGSWFPSGYYGHFRSKSRNDFTNEYRLLARPLPPKNFIHRSQTDATRHVFSHHDNRQSFLNDALYFEEGLGRRRVPNNTNRYKSDFIAWMPHKKDLEKSGTLNSTYELTFRGNNHKKQLCVHRPKTSFDEDQPVTTSYRYAHGNDSPNKAMLNAMNNVALLADTRKVRASSARQQGRETVASCLSWYTPQPPSTQKTFRSNIPLATQTYPPSEPRTVMQTTVTPPTPQVVMATE